MSHISDLTAAIVTSFDKSAQDLVLIEEMSELTKELLKRRRGSTNYDAIKEEVSHVLISLHVVKTVLDISDEEIEAEAKRKLDKYSLTEEHSSTSASSS